MFVKFLGNVPKQSKKPILGEQNALHREIFHCLDNSRRENISVVLNSRKMDPSQSVSSSVTRDCSKFLLPSYQQRFYQSGPGNFPNDLPFSRPARFNYQQNSAALQSETAPSDQIPPWCHYWWCQRPPGAREINADQRSYLRRSNPENQAAQRN